ncbi:monocarboxylate transporter 13-like [Mytilus californianus]|uniref:monocarboxylate transporter 13-like n=1 Tax=Mytilus californianus TaxID=6549 RepID=UPI002247EEB6|nr:monocarboxylate transporter 13-like [Mytilus californianus]
MDKSSNGEKNEGKNLNRKNVDEPITAKPPDGGWGWVVVFSSLMCNILVDGIGLAYGVLLPKFAEYFQTSKSKVSLVGSLLIGMYLCAGPIVSALVNKFGCRPVTIAGSVVAAVGFIAGSFSPNLDILILTYGVIGGFGFGMVYLPSIVSVGYYFDKKRPLATGIAVCGSGIGTFIFSPLLEYLSEVYDWRNLLRIMAGIILNGAVCGMLMRPIKSKNNQNMLESSSDVSSDSGIKVDKKRLDSSSDATSDVTKFDQKKPEIDSDIDCDTVSEHLSKEGIHLREVQPFIHVEQKQNVHRINRRSSSLNDLSQFQRSNYTDKRCAYRDRMKLVRTHEIIYSGSMLYIPQFHSHPNLVHTNSVYSIQSSYSQRVTFWDRCTCLPDTVLTILKEMLDFSLLLNIPFLLLCIGNIFACTGFFIPFYFLVDRALILGTPNTQAAFLLSIIGITNTIGRLLSGMVANLKNVDALVVNNIALLIAALTLFLQPLCTVYPALVAFSVIFGLSVAAFISLTSIILCDLLGLNRLANAFGLLTLARGIAGIAGPPAAGAVFQATGNYDASFYFGGGMFFVGALLHLMLHLPFIKRLNDAGKQETIVKETYEEDEEC